MTIGPVQLLVIGFEHGECHDKIEAELDRLRDTETIRLIDVLFIRKDADGNVERIHRSDVNIEESEEIGATVGALIGLGIGGKKGAWYVEDALPNDTAAALGLIEHRWATGLRDLSRDAGGFHLADAWIHPLDLMAIGLMAAEEAEQAHA